MATTSSHAVPRRRLVLLLGGSAGFLDAVGYLTLGIFTANMTGNTVLLGIAAGQGHWPALARVLLALAAFVMGAAVGAVLAQDHRRLGIVYAVEAALLLTALGTWALLGRPGSPISEPAAAFPLIGLLSAAMGAQSAAVRRVGEQRVSTTYVTGTLTSLAVDATSEILARWEKRPRPAPHPSIPSRSAVPLWFGMWATYAGGALAGGFSQHQWGFWVVLLPIAVFAATALWDLSRRAA